MKCFHPECDRAPHKGDNLYRQNAKGEPGVFACAQHSRPVADELVRTVAQVQQLRRCGHPLGTTRWCPDCELESSKGGRR